jgi:FMN reductase
MTNSQHQTLRLVVISAGASDPSSSRMLADRVTARVSALAGSGAHGQPAEAIAGGGAAGAARRVSVTVVELREIATEVAAALTSQLTGPRLRAAIDALAAADGVVAVAPVYKAGVSGLFKSFIDVLDDDLLIGTPVVLAATAGTARHALVADDQMRPLFAYLRALPVPTSLFATPEDWSDGALGARVDRAATELLLLMDGGFARALRGQSWGSYQHEFGSAARAPEAAGAFGEEDIDTGTDLMRLATGGTAAR